MSERRRAGGRSARVALRATAPDVPVVTPGMTGGKYRPLTDTQCDDIAGAALYLLEHLGMGDPIPKFVEVVTAAGGRLDDDGRLRFPEKLVRSAIDMAAKEVRFCGFQPEHDLVLGGSRVHLGTSGAAVSIVDLDKRTFRPSFVADLYDLARLADTLEHINYFIRTVIPRDVEDIRDADINTAYAVMMGTAKPIGTSFYEARQVYDVAEMFDIALGRPGAFKERPFCVCNDTMAVPPMRFAMETCEGVVAQVETGMIPNLLSAGQAGATSPASLAGALVQGLAECLAGLTAVNLLSPGHPAVMGLWPFVSDLRTGAMTGGSGEEAVLNAAAAQVVNHLGLPSGVAAGMTDSKLPDNQAGYEKGITVTLAAAAGANLVNESAGMMGSLLGSSFEALVIDNDMLGAINRTVRGIEVTTDTLAVDEIIATVRGPGHFLGNDRTLELMQRDYLYPQVADRLSPEDWEDAGATDVVARARAVVEQTLATHYPDHVDPDADAEIRRRFPIALPESDVRGTSGRW